jgi:hypothetical protein
LGGGGGGGGRKEKRKRKVPCLPCAYIHTYICTLLYGVCMYVGLAWAERFLLLERGKKKEKKKAQDLVCSLKS